MKQAKHGVGTGRRLRAALLTSTALALIGPAAALAQDATWQINPGSGDFFDPNNWAPNTVPNGTATFGTSSTTTLTLGSSGAYSGWTFNAGAPNYTFTIGAPTSQGFTGAGITSYGGRPSIVNNGNLSFNVTSTAATASITNAGVLLFNDASTAGSATITNSGTLRFLGVSSGGNAALINQAGGTVDISGVDTSTTAGSIAGAGNYVLGSNRLIVGSNDLSTEVSGVISGTGGGLDKSGAGTLTLTGANTYTGGTAINGGALQLGSDSAVGSILGTVTIGSSGAFNVFNADTSGTTITNGGLLSFRNTSTAGSGAINNNYYMYVLDTSTAGSAIITNSRFLGFYNLSSAGSATITNGNNLQFFSTSTAGNATITNNGTLEFHDASAAGNATITNNSSLSFYDASTAGGAAITNNGSLYFSDTSTAGSATIASNSDLQFFHSSTAGNATITNDGGLVFRDTSTAGDASIVNGYIIFFDQNSTAGRATITNNGGIAFRDASTAGNAIIINNGGLTFRDNSTADTAAIINNASGGVDFTPTAGPGGDGKVSAGSIAGAGVVALGANELTVGSNNLSTEVSGVISGSGSLVKTGMGTLTLSGINTYTGATTIDGGVLRVDGSNTSSSGVTVHANGALMGTGMVSGTAVNSGGSLRGGNGTAGTSLAISGNLAFQSGAYYLVQVNPVTASSVNVTGGATLGGATVNAVFAPGSYVAKQYTILTAGSVSGTFGSLVDTNLPSNFHTELSYDGTHAYLNLILSFVSPQGSGLSRNQQNVGNAIINSFNANGSISLVYSGLTAAGLTQASGETAAGSQATTFQAMGQFMGLLTDPFGVGRETGPSAPPAYADNGPAGAARDAYAMLAKVPPAKTFEQRWNVWAAGFGGSQTTDGSTAQGSNSVTSRLFGTAAGANYWFSPQTLAGFALAGGGTNFSVTGGGTGRSDLFQAGAYVRHHHGPSYVSAALAYGWQDVTTDRTVRLAGVDRLRAEFNANAWSGRVEGGYRFLARWLGGVGLTPYAAGQFTTFNLPAYAEKVVSGSNAFALAYAAKSVTDTRSELGLRADRSIAVSNGLLTLRGRAAWAHDFNPDRTVAATFQALPGASFVTNGARSASNSALTTASAEVQWRNGWSAVATFEGEFSNVTRSYAGKGAVRYAW